MKLSSLILDALESQIYKITWIFLCPIRSVPTSHMLKRESSFPTTTLGSTGLQWRSFQSRRRSCILIHIGRWTLISLSWYLPLMSKFFFFLNLQTSSTNSAEFINGALTIVVCFVVVLGIVTAMTTSCPAAPWTMRRLLMYVLLSISCLWKLIVKLEFIPSHHCLSMYIYRSATNNLTNPESAASIVPITCLQWKINSRTLRYFLGICNCNTCNWAQFLLISTAHVW